MLDVCIFKTLTIKSTPLCTSAANEASQSPQAPYLVVIASQKLIPHIAHFCVHFHFVFIKIKRMAKFAQTTGKLAYMCSVQSKINERYHSTAAPYIFLHNISELIRVSRKASAQQKTYTGNTYTDMLTLWYTTPNSDFIMLVCTLKKNSKRTKLKEKLSKKKPQFTKMNMRREKPTKNKTFV